MESTDIGWLVIGASVEDLVIKAEAVTNRIDTLKHSRASHAQLFSKALEKMSNRERVLLFVYYRKNILLTNKEDLIAVQQKMIDELDHFKNKKHTEDMRMWRQTKQEEAVI